MGVVIVEVVLVRLVLGGVVFDGSGGYSEWDMMVVGVGWGE